MLIKKYIRTGAVIIMLFCFAVINTKCTNNKLSITHQTAEYSYSMLEADLAALKKRYPLSLRISAIGTTSQGRKIYAAVAGTPGAKHHVLIHASIHAREHITTTLVMMQLERLLKAGVPSNFNFHIIPMVNPDGVAISQLESNTAFLHELYDSDTSRGLTDEPLEEYLRRFKSNARGIDINRNFDAGWERVDTRTAPSSEGYRGSVPVGENETAALVDYTKRFTFSATISYHAAGGEIYYDFGVNQSANILSHSLAKAISRSTGYKLIKNSGVSFGGYKDWAIESMSIPSLTIEVGSGKAPLSISELGVIWKQNRNTPYITANWVKATYGYKSRS